MLASDALKSAVPRISKHWREEIEVEYTIKASAAPCYPDSPDLESVPAGNVADIDRALNLLAVTSSTEVNVKDIKGLSALL